MQAVNTSEFPRAGVGTVASDERSALIGAPMRLLEPAGATPVDSSDATQQLLTSLGRFQRELTNALDETQRGYWAEECMNQLIDCVEVALPHGWSEMVEALTDTGRILQSYENAQQAERCVEFLNDAYELLCLMVGDLIVDKIRPAVMKQWRDRYQTAIAQLEADGLQLISDDAEPAATGEVVAFTGNRVSTFDLSSDLPFEMPDELSSGRTDDDALPTLDELPPLEAVLDHGSGHNAPRSAAAASAPAPEAAPEADVRRREPSRLVVEILDQLCEQLATIETESSDKAAYAMDRFNGGVRAIEREARDQDHALAVELCELMLRASRAAAAPAGGYRDGFTELGYAFCGAYMDAFHEDDLETVSSWRVECKGLISTWEQAEASADAAANAAVEASANAAVEAAPSVETFDIVVPEEEIVEFAIDLPEEPAVVETEPVEAIAPGPVEATAAIAAAVAAAGAEVVAEEPVESPIDETTSSGLLEAAQRAARKGDAGEAKRFALQAANAIARDEVKAASNRLAQTKERLKSSLESMREARDYVKETETAVQEMAAGVSAGETALGKAREESARIAQQLEDLRAGVTEIERQIAELQERREHELEKVAQTDNELGAASNRVMETEEELAERRAAEAAARTDLETRRQTVNDLQRGTNEIETEVDAANALLDEKQKSYDDITEAIRQICGEADAKSRDEGLLF